MALEPTRIYTRRIDPRGVLALLRTLDPEVQVVGPDDAWESATVSPTQPGVAGPWTLTFFHDPAAYDSDDWLPQRQGLQRFFGRAPESEQRTLVQRLIGSFRFVLGLGYEPALLPQGDTRLAYLAAVVRHLDGVLFETFSLRDAEGRLLLAVNGDFDPEAVCPAIPEPVRVVAEEHEAEEGPDYRTQPPERVAQRALALTAVAVRALLEQEDPADPGAEEFRERILEWIDDLDLGEELEPDEWEIVQRPVGLLERQQQINATWRLEGLAVLAWALRRFEMPPPDELVVPRDLVAALGFLDVPACRVLLAAPTLRPDEELEWQAGRLLGLHWRLRDYRLRPEAMDFLAFSKACWFGSFDITGIELIDNDLALGGRALKHADAEAITTAFSAARERHLAMKWLRGFSRVYSETDTST